MFAINSKGLRKRSNYNDLLKSLPVFIGPDRTASLIRDSFEIQNLIHGWQASDDNDEKNIEDLGGKFVRDEYVHPSSFIDNVTQTDNVIDKTDNDAQTDAFEDKMTRYFNIGDNEISSHISKYRSIIGKKKSRVKHLYKPRKMPHEQDMPMPQGQSFVSTTTAEEVDDNDNQMRVDDVDMQQMPQTGEIKRAIVNDSNSRPLAKAKTMPKVASKRTKEASSQNDKNAKRSKSQKPLELTTDREIPKPKPKPKPKPAPAPAQSAPAPASAPPIKKDTSALKRLIPPSKVGLQVMNEMFTEAKNKGSIPANVYWAFVKLYERRSGRDKDKDGKRLPRPPKEQQNNLLNQMKQMYGEHIFKKLI